jgi:DNA processing protein
MTAEAVLGRACEPCLRRAWLLDRLVGHIANLADDRPSMRGHELLALPDDELVAAVTGPEDRDPILGQARSRGAHEVATATAKCGAWALCEHADDYPPGLRDLDASRPRALFCHGDPSHLARLETNQTVAIVGARRATDYGTRTAVQLSRSLAANRIAIVSGMALGIDGAAHAGALEAGGITVAVLGGGCDIPYPASNTRLYGRIRERGLVISEMPPQTRARRWCFPARNRIMAAIAGMSVIVQAIDHSGSLITAARAREIGRDVGAVPGNINLPLSAGTNALIADGAALIRNARDVLDALLGPGTMPLTPAAPPPALDPPTRAALDAIGDGPATADGVAQRSGLDGRAVAIALARLELFGYVTRTSSGTYARTNLTA